MLEGIVNFSDPLFQKAVLVIVLTPVIWNIIARLEYYTHILTKLFCGNKYYGCYALATYIFLFSAYRDYLFKQAIEAQPQWSLLVSFSPYTQYIGYILGAIGTVFVLSSMWALGITGTYLGDYFGILMDAPVTGFPFNVLNDPMYDGATMCFLAQALLANSGVGVVLSLVVFVVYRCAVLLEGPFTSRIYAEREAKRSGDVSSSSSASDALKKKKKARKID